MIKALLFLATAVALIAAPAPPLQGKISGGFQAPSTTDPQGRRSVVKGTDATPQGNNVYLITKPQVTSFNPDDTPEMYINAERCLLNMQTTIASSDSSLAVRTADKRFSLEGTGWQWDPRSSFLVISNKVSALVEKSAIQMGVTNQPTAVAGTNQPVRITSERFQQDGEDASFIGDVLVHDGPDTLRCARLNLKFVKPGGLQKIEAIQNVELQQGGTTVRSGQALYDLRENTLTITRNPTWVINEREGSAERLFLNRSNNTLFADGSVFMKLPLTNVISGGQTNRTATNRVVEVYADHFTFQNATSNTLPSAVYRDHVRVRHENGTIECAQLNALFDAQQRLKELDAQGEVKIESEGRRAFGERAQYDLGAEKVSLTGSPRWEMEQRSGSSETFIFYPRSGELFALGHVEMYLPAAAGSSFGPRGSKANAASLGRDLMRIRAKMFSHQTNVSVFQEEVEVVDLRGTIECDLLTVVTGATNQIQRVVAEHNVRMTQKDMIASGTRADYNFGTGLVYLTGDPELVSDEKTLRAEAFVINRNANTFSVAPGTYRIEMKVKNGTGRRTLFR